MFGSRNKRKVAKMVKRMKFVRDGRQPLRDAAANKSQEAERRHQQDIWSSCVKSLSNKEMYEYAQKLRGVKK